MDRQRDVRLISMALNQSPTWNIGLSAWIVQDGSYPDFGVNETAQFAVEFCQRPETALEASNSDVVAKHLRDATYQVVGKKIEETSKSWCITSIRITSILRQTAPFIETVHGGRKVLSRDASRLGYEEMRKTDAWHDDKGRADYVLVCDLLPAPAK
jgi:hypothetical protein